MRVWLRVRDWFLAPYYEWRWSRILKEHRENFPNWWERDEKGGFVDRSGKGW